MTFDQWNRQETNRIASQSDSDTAKNVKKARSGGLWRFMAYDDYVAYCEQHDITPEPLFSK